MIKPAQAPNKCITLFDNKVIDLSQPNIMGILNVTPDSFSDGGRYLNVDNALSQCEQMLKDGASIIDVGGESTRPNAAIVSLSEEEDRVLPIIEAIHNNFDAIISVDTSTPSLMQSAHQLGAHIWNDVRALTKPDATKTAAELNIPVMMMHMRGEPTTMMTMTDYDDVITEVKTELMQQVQHAIDAGVQQQNIILDVGFGFAKNKQQNYTLLKNLSQFHDLGFALMIGLSRKRMLADALAEAGLNNDIENRIPVSIAANTLAVLQGVSIIRTHDVLMTAQGLAMTQALAQIN